MFNDENVNFTYSFLQLYADSYEQTLDFHRKIPFFREQ